MIDYEAEEDRSYIFLIYPPNHDRAENPDLAITRYGGIFLLSLILFYDNFTYREYCVLPYDIDTMIPKIHSPEYGPVSRNNLRYKKIT